MLFQGDVKYPLCLNELQGLMRFFYDNGTTFAFKDDRRMKLKKICYFTYFQEITMKAFSKLTIALFLLSVSVEAGATILNVDVAGGSDYTTVTEALTYAMPGDIVFVESGTYTKASGEKFPLSIPTDITIVGNDAHKPIFRTAAKTTAFEVREESRITIRSLKINTALNGITILSNADNITIDNCEINNCSQYGILVQNASNTTITSTLITNTLSAIKLHTATKTMLTHNTLIGITPKENTIGLDIIASDIAIQRTIIDGFNCGVQIKKIDPSKITLTNNAIHACSTPYNHDVLGVKIFTNKCDVHGNVNSKPLFVNRGTGDFHLQQHSTLSGLGAYPETSLPVNAAKLQGTIQYDAVQIQWVTHVEKTNQGWNLYRGFSSDGPFEKINSDIIMGAGNSSSKRNYSFYDENIPPVCGDMYYYLEQVSSNGKKSFSQTLNVSTRKQVTAVSDAIFNN